MYYTLFLLCLLTASYLVEFVSSSTFGFSCAGTTYQAALAACPDKGRQRMTSGGNVTVLVQRANNLPNADFSSAASAGVSDPYVRFTVGNVVVESKPIRDSLNPKWNEYVNIGILGAATEVKVEIWDSDTGIEFSDDLLVKSSFRVPFCSTFSADEYEVDCGKPFGCESDDSAWHMPKRKMCVEGGFVAFKGGAKCHTNGICLNMTIFIVPVQVEVELEYSVGPTTPKLISGPLANQDTSIDTAPWVAQWQPYSDLPNTLFDPSYTQSNSLMGALMMQTKTTDSYLGPAETIHYYAGMNFPSWVYVCRPQEDNEKAIPKWIQDNYSDQNKSITQLRLGSVNAKVYQCFYRYQEATEKNKYGGVIKNALPVYTNTVAGRDSGSLQDNAFYDNNFVLLFIPEVIAPRGDLVVVSYDMAQFVGFAFTYGGIWMWFTFLAMKFLRKLDFRADRISSFLSTRVMTGDDRTLLAGLFLQYGQTPCNIDFRSHMFHARNIIMFGLSIPFFLLLSWGFSVLYVVRPAGLGYAVTFGGMAYMFLWYALNLWRTSHWRLSPIAAGSLAAGTFCFIVFMLSAIFRDPGIEQYGYTVNVAALSLVFGVCNVVPLLVLVFDMDQSQISNLNNFVKKLHAAIDASRPQGKSENQGKRPPKAKKNQNINKLLHEILGKAYTINPRMPVFKFSTVLQEIVKEKALTPENSRPPTATVLEGLDAIMAAAPPPAPEIILSTKTKRLYGASLLVLFVYFVIAAVRTSAPSLAFLNCLALILLDMIHLLLTRGEHNWSPGYTITLLIVGRVFIMGSPQSLWVLNYSACYVIYAVVLLKEFLNTYLPMISTREAGEFVFSGDSDIDREERERAETFNKKAKDVAGTSYFCLGLLTFAFASVLLVASLRSAHDELMVPYLEVFGMPNWDITIFGLGAIMLVVVIGLVWATVRSYYLQKHNLLQGRAKEAFFMYNYVTLPVMLAIITEIVIIACGMLIYGITGSPAVLVSAIFFPLIGLSLGHAYRTWRRNDFDLVVWPPKPEKPIHGDGSSDMQVAFNMVEGMFGKSDQVENSDSMAVEEIEDEEDEDDPDNPKPETVAPVSTKFPPRTLKGFRLPAMKPTGSNPDDNVKMPPLPLKSVLRRKRQAMGVKTAENNLVQDLQARDDTKDPDKFGDDQEVIDLNDPWAQFDLSDDEDAEDKAAKKKSGTKRSTSVQVQSILGAPSRAFHAVKQSKAGKAIAKVFTDLSKMIKGEKKIHPKEGKYAEDVDEESQVLDEDDEDYVQDTKATISAKPKSGKEVATVEPRVGQVELTREEIAKMPFSQAMWGGYLNGKEYSALGAWYGGMFLVMLYGICIGATVNPAWMGHVLWVSAWTAILSYVVIFKYFHTYKIDPTMKQLMYFGVFFHFMFVLIFFIAGLNSDVGVDAALWLFDYFVYYPFVLYMFSQAFKWYDSGFVIAPIDINFDGKISVEEVLKFFKSAPMLFAFTVLFIWQLYIWISIMIGQLVTIGLIISIVIYFYLRDWALNDFYLSTELAQLGIVILNLTMLITFCVALFSTDTEVVVFSGSLFLFTFAFKHSLYVIGEYMLMENERSIVFFSPVVLPVYSYDSATNDLKDHTQVFLRVIYILLCGVAWGSLMLVFYYPADIGTALCCCFLLAIAALCAIAMCHVPVQLGRASMFINPEGIYDAASVAQEKFQERRLPLTYEMELWEGNDAVTHENAGLPERKKSTFEKDCERQALEIAIEITADLRSLKYIQDDGPFEEVKVDEDKDEDEYEQTWFQERLIEFHALVKKLFELIPVNKNKGWKKHSEATFTFKDAIAEALITGRGSFGFLGLEGLWYGILQRMKKSHSWKKYYPQWIDKYDNLGNDSTVHQLAETMDVKGLYTNLRIHDKATDFCFGEESRCAIHFLLLIQAAADAKFQREQVLFQKFLRENRFRLASNGITPPREVFSSTSYASIDIKLVAVWLQTLTKDERDRFHMLRSAFVDDQSGKDALIDQADYDFLYDAQSHLEEVAIRDKYIADKFAAEVLKLRSERIQEFALSLEGFERVKFMKYRDLWVSDSSCFVEVKDRDLFNRFREACLEEHVNDNQEVVLRAMAQIESAQKDTRLGEYGRSYQFVDSEFPPGDNAVGVCEGAASVLGWRCAPGISETAQLFDGGTHPDFIEQGVFSNNYLLSALSMMIAASDFNNGRINEQILKSFVGHAATYGEEVSLQTEVGVYCVQIYKNGQWLPMIIDDVLPMRRKESWTNENRGIASAHNTECKGLWVSLLEKAFAKYMGSYANLEKGFVHHALEALTGAHSECLSLSAASRGMGKRPLWSTLKRCKKNGYALGCGTGDGRLLDKELHNMGIMFNAHYTIYDIVSIDGLQLIKLRNPPGDHPEFHWKGDYGESSSLWSHRLRHQLEYDPEAEPNTFFMTFDDFCNVFRYLYICNYHNPKKWLKQDLSGVWKKSNEAEIERLEMIAQMQQELEGDMGGTVKKDVEKENRQKAKARLDCAGGLPSKFNPGCILEDNPHYHLKIVRPTDIVITVTQVVKVNQTVIQPFSIVVVKSPETGPTTRLKELTRDVVVGTTGKPQQERILRLELTALAPCNYTVLVAAYLKGMEGTFTVSCLSSYRCELNPVWPPVWMLRDDAEANAALDLERAQTPGGTRSVFKNEANAVDPITKFGLELRKGLKIMFGGDHDGDSDDDDDEDEDDRQERNNFYDSL